MKKEKSSDEEIKTHTASESPYVVNGLFDANSYSSDIPLMKNLGLKPFQKLPTGTEHFVGEVKFENGSSVKIWVFPMPTQFWKFEVFDKENGKTTIVSTGSGSLSGFWPSIKLIADNMLVLDHKEG